MCPACFDFTEIADDYSVNISVDGNMQHGRFRDPNPLEFEVMPTKVFVDWGRRDFAKASDWRNAQKQPVLAPAAPAKPGRVKSACGNLFKATKEWSKPDESGCGAIPSARNFDETGLVGFVCLHGTSLRYLNIYTGERQTHVTALLQNLLSEKPDIKRLRLCYDVACTFGPALKVCRTPTQGIAF